MTSTWKLGEQPRDLGRALARQQAPVVGQADLGDDRQVAGGLHGHDRLAQLLEVAERLQHDQVGAGLEERVGLLAEGAPARLLGGDRADRRDGLSERPDRAGQEDRLAALLARLAGQLDGRKLMSRTRSSSPYGASLKRLAP